MIVVPGVGAIEPGPNSFLEMKRRVAEPVGRRNDEQVLSEAGHHIIRAIQSLNMMQGYAFMREAAADESVSEGDLTLDFASDVFIPITLKWINSDSEVAFTTEGMSWDAMNAYMSRQTGEGMPMRWAIKDPYTERKWHFNQKVDATTAADYKIRQEYYQRIPIPEGAADVVAGPPEASAAVELIAQYRLYRNRRPNQVAAWGSIKKDAAEAVMMFKQSMSRDHGITERFRWGPGDEIHPLDGLKEWWRM